VIEAVTFDFWGTLYTEGPAADRRRQLRLEYARDFLVAMEAGVTGRQMEYALEILAHDVEHLRATRQVGVTAEDIGSRLARIVGVELDRRHAEELGALLSAAGREQPPKLIDGALRLLQTLHGEVKLALICDTGLTLGHDLYAVMEADGAAQLLDHFTFSNQTHTTKPMLRQFHHTLGRLGCSPEEAVHVGDLEDTDVAGAREAGMRAIRIVRPGEDPATAADAAVENINQVLGVLRGWGLGT